MPSLRLRIPPPLVLAAFVTAAVVLARWLPRANWAFPGHRVLALAAVVLGLAAAVAGVLAFGRARTTVNPLQPERASTLVRGGVYRLSRNPMYLGMALVLAGVALWWGSLAGLALLVPGFMAYLNRFQIGPEEQAMRQRFGADFEAYCAQVRRWL